MTQSISEEKKNYTEYTQEERWNWLFERISKADEPIDKPYFFEALRYEISQALTAERKELREKWFSHKD